MMSVTRIRPTDVLQWAAFLLVMAGCGFLLLRGADNLGYIWQWNRIPRYLVQVTAEGLRPGPLLEGILVTLGIVAISLVLSLLIGLIVALMRLSDSLMAVAVARVYLELIRNTPLLVQLFVVYFVFAPIFDIGRFTAAVVALSLFEGAYASEIIRAGIRALPDGQWQASEALGMNRHQTYRHIILPQALRNMTPPLTSQGIALVKDSALVSTIAIYDLTMRGQQLVAETFLAFEVWFTVAAIYLALTLSLAGLVVVLERRLFTQTGYLNTNRSSL